VNFNCQSLLSVSPNFIFSVSDGDLFRYLSFSISFFHLYFYFESSCERDRIWVLGLCICYACCCNVWISLVHDSNSLAGMSNSVPIRDTWLKVFVYWKPTIFYSKFHFLTFFFPPGIWFPNLVMRGSKLKRKKHMVGVFLLSYFLHFYSTLECYLDLTAIVIIFLGTN
jgi:hypothetical protein